MPPADETKVLQRLRWAAMRIGGVTASFTVYFDSFVGFPTPYLWDLEQFVAASYGATQHEELECFKTEMLESESSPASSEGFSDWLYRLGVSLQAVCLHAESSRRILEKGFGTPVFAKLRHLELCVPASIGKATQQLGSCRCWKPCRLWAMPILVISVTAAKQIVWICPGVCTSEDWSSSMLCQHDCSSQILAIYATIWGILFPIRCMSCGV